MDRLTVDVVVVRQPETPIACPSCGSIVVSEERFFGGGVIFLCDRGCCPAFVVEGGRHDGPRADYR